ncbi:uroporphyrinogen decarboxylase family protein [Verrucomicrobiota bacterium]
MTSKERLIAALRCEDVDYVPMVLNFWKHPLHPKCTWTNERERIAFYLDHGWDATVTTSTWVTPAPAVRVQVEHESQAGKDIIKQTWHTPAGKLVERLEITDDWVEAKGVTDYIPLDSDFRTSRYIEAPIKPDTDPAVFEYLFPKDNPRDIKGLENRLRSIRELGGEFQLPVILEHLAGMDWLLWLFPAEEMVFMAIDHRPLVEALLNQINKAFRARLEFALAFGVDAVQRRGLYETTDFWSPDTFGELARPAVEQETAMTHDAGAVFLYDMMTGMVPLLPQLAEMSFDCLIDVDPAYVEEPGLSAIKKGLPGKSIWGGISAPEHIGRGTPAQTERAVEAAFDVCGHNGFILGPRAGIRSDWPWDNVMACDTAWRRCREP